MGFPNAYTIYKDGNLYAFVESIEPLNQEQIQDSLQPFLPFHCHSTGNPPIAEPSPESERENRP